MPETNRILSTQNKADLYEAATALEEDHNALLAERDDLLAQVEELEASGLEFVRGWEEKIAGLEEEVSDRREMEAADVVTIEDLIKENHAFQAQIQVLSDAPCGKCPATLDEDEAVLSPRLRRAIEHLRAFGNRGNANLLKQAEMLLREEIGLLFRR